MNWALEIDGVCRELTEIDPVGRFADDPRATWRICAPSVAPGDIWDGTDFARPVAPAPTLADRLAALSDERYGRQIAGVAFKPAGQAAAAFVASDPVSTGMLTASYTAARDGHWVDGTPWKMVDGSFVGLTAADMQALALTVLGYVSACFSHEGKLAAALAADLSTDITQGWPSNGQDAPA